MECIAIRDKYRAVNRLARVQEAWPNSTVIEANASTMRQLETVQERMRKMTQDELSRYQLDNRLGGMSEFIAYKVRSLNLLVFLCFVSGVFCCPKHFLNGLAITPKWCTSYMCNVTLSNECCCSMLQALQRLYGEKIEDIMEGLRKTPAAAVPVVLRRCALAGNSRALQTGLVSRLARKSSSVLRLPRFAQL